MISFSNEPTTLSRPASVLEPMRYCLMKIRFRPGVKGDRCTGLPRNFNGTHVAAYKRVLIIAFIILSLGHARVGTSQPRLRLAFNHYWPPYSAQDEHQRPAGIFFDILNEALNQRMRIPFEAVSLPWARVQSYIRGRKVDGLITVPTRERLRYLVASKNVFSISLHVYVNSVSPNYTAFADVTDVAGLSPFQACEINGNQSAIERYQRFQLEKVKLVAKYTQCFKMLSHQRVDFVVVPRALARKLIVDLDMPASIVEVPLQISANHHLLLHKQSPYVDVLPELNRVIQKMREEGVIEEIVARHRVRQGR